MKTLLLASLFICLLCSAQDNSTPDYDELINLYTRFAEENSEVGLYKMGDSDFGKSIFLCVLGAEQDSIQTFSSLRSSTTLLINNAIHAGEPCGVNASIQIVKDYLALSPKEKSQYPKVAIIPAYNVGGMHNRSSFSRANQEGPSEYGFRGNAQNLDLNRDFIKIDSKNMQTFAKIYHATDPDVFIDTHTSNGADYQYTITYIASLRERIATSLQNIVYNEMIPDLQREIKLNFNYDLFPYIQLFGSRLNEGIVAFNDLPRYSMGYCNLFNTISFTTETHMLKPFEDRVRSTYAFIKTTILYMQNQSDAIEAAREKAFKEDQQQTFYTFNYVIDSLRNKNSTIRFKGYEYADIPSKLTPQPRLYYDRSKPVESQIPFYFHYLPLDTLIIPQYYVVGKQEEEVVNRLKLNGVELNVLKADSIITVNQIRIEKFETTATPYEGHYLHSSTQVHKFPKEVLFKKGDVLINTHQKRRKFIVSVLSPEAEDSYFAWNFFDSYLQQKEYFSPYIFEEKAVEILESNPELKAMFEKKQQEEDFVNSRWNQLYFIYKNSPYYEPTHRVLPVFEIN